MKCSPGNKVLLHLEPHSCKRYVRLFLLCHATLQGGTVPRPQAVQTRRHFFNLTRIYLVPSLLDPECGEQYFASSHMTLKDLKHRLLIHRSYFPLKLSLQRKTRVPHPWRRNMSCPKAGVFAY